MKLTVEHVDVEIKIQVKLLYILQKYAHIYFCAVE